MLAGFKHYNQFFVVSQKNNMQVVLFCPGSKDAFYSVRHLGIIREVTMMTKQSKQYKQLRSAFLKVTLNKIILAG